MAFCSCFFRRRYDLVQPEVESPEAFRNDNVFNGGFCDSLRTLPTYIYYFSFSSGLDFTVVYVNEDFIGDLIGPVGEMVHASCAKGSYVVYGPLDFDSHLKYLFLSLFMLHFLSLVFQEASPHCA